MWVFFYLSFILRCLVLMVFIYSFPCFQNLLIWVFTLHWKTGLSLCMNFGISFALVGCTRSTCDEKVGLLLTHPLNPLFFHKLSNPFFTGFFFQSKIAKMVLVRQNPTGNLNSVLFDFSPSRFNSFLSVELLTYSLYIPIITETLHF